MENKYQKKLADVRERLATKIQSIELDKLIVLRLQELEEIYTQLAEIERNK